MEVLKQLAFYNVWCGSKDRKKQERLRMVLIIATTAGALFTFSFS